MIHDIFMPALSSTMTEGKIVSWVKKPGDKVEKGETVLVVESDKADMDVESFYEGYLATILVEAGQQAPVGATIGLVAETQAEIEQVQASSPSASKPAAKEPKEAKGGKKAAKQEKAASTAPVAPPAPPAPEPAPLASSNNGRIVVSPRARKLAKDLKVDVESLQGSGPFGRIVAADIEKAAGKAPTPTQESAPQPPASAPTPVKPIAATSAPVTSGLVGETVALNTLQQAVVRNMVASLEVPVFRVSYSITTDALDKLYQQIKSKGVTMTALLAKAVAVTLKKHPLLNAAYTEGGIQYRPGINIAIAVAMKDGGLITPVLQNADAVDIYSLSRNWKDLVERARTKQLQPNEYTTGSFTLSNLGMFGVDSFDAILPPGQGSILAVGASRPQVVATPEGLIGTKSVMKVNITCDHRIIYGADAAAFLQDLAKLIQEETQSLTL